MKQQVPISTFIQVLNIQTHYISENFVKTRKTLTMCNMQNMTESPLHLTQSKHYKKFNFRLESMMQLGLCIYISTLIKK